MLDYDMLFILLILCVFFFKQKTAYDMRMSDWSSDVCSSDLAAVVRGRDHRRRRRFRPARRRDPLETRASRLPRPSERSLAPHNPHFAARLGLDRRPRRLVQFALPQPDLDPLAVLVADPAIHPPAPKPRRFVTHEPTAVGY